jgi:hypothetical protein
MIFKKNVNPWIAVQEVQNVCKDTNINMIWGKIQMYKELKYRG